MCFKKIFILHYVTSPFPFFPQSAVRCTRHSLGFPACDWNNHGKYPQHVLACMDDVSVKKTCPSLHGHTSYVQIYLFLSYFYERCINIELPTNHCFKTLHQNRQNSTYGLDIIKVPYFRLENSSFAANVKNLQQTLKPKSTFLLSQLVVRKPDRNGQILSGKVSNIGSKAKHMSKE